VADSTVKRPTGYRIVTFTGRVLNYGDAVDHGSANTWGVSALASTDGGYWLVTLTGKVLPFGAATNLGDLSGRQLTKPVIAMAATPTGKGYWLTTSDGAVFPFGDAQHYEDASSLHLNASVIGMTPTPTGHGYWLLASDGGIFSFGDAAFYGSTGNVALHAPIVAMAPTPSTLVVPTSCGSTSRFEESPALPTVAVTGLLAVTAASSPTAMPGSSDQREPNRTSASSWPSAPRER
jgi:hypothetical protein